MARASSASTAAAAAAPALAALPAWANFENRALQARIERATLKLNDASARESDDAARADAMRDALHQLGLQLRGCQAHGEAQRAEATTEDSLRRMLDQNDAQLREETKQARKVVAALDGQTIALQADAYRGAERLGQFQLLADWRLEEMQQWVLVSHQKDGDTAALQQYRKQDVAKIRELMGQPEQRSKQVAVAEQQLADLDSAQKAAQIELTRATADLQALQAERHAVTSQWQDTLEACTRRNEAVQDVDAREGAAAGELNETLAVLREEQQGYQDAVDANRRAARGIKELERVLDRQRQEYTAGAAALATAEQDAEVQRSTQGKLRQELAAAASANQTSSAANERQGKRLEVSRKQLADASAKCEAEARQLGFVVADDARLEAMLRDETKHADGAEAAVGRAREQQIKSGQRLASLVAKEEELQQGIRGGFAARKNANSRIAELNEQVRYCSSEQLELQQGLLASRIADARIAELKGQAVRQQELVYNAQYALAMAEHKVERASGSRTADESAALIEALEAARAALQPAKVEHADMQAALRSAEAALERTRRQNADAQASNAHSSEALLKLTCELDSIGHNFAAMTNTQAKENKLVLADLLSLELGKKQAAESAQKSEIAALAGQKDVLQESMSERRLQIQAYLGSLQAEQKRVRAALADASMAAQQAQMRRDRLAEKRAVIGSTVVPTATADQARNLNLAACAELQRQIEEVQVAIAAAEGDLAVVKAALRETLAVNADKDAQLRNNMVTEEDVKLRRLADDLTEAQHALKGVQAEHARAEQDAGTQQAQLAQLSAVEAQLTARLSDLQKTQGQLKKALQAQHERTARAKQQAEKSRARARSAPPRSLAGGASGQPIDEGEIRCLELQEAARCISQAVAAFSAQQEAEDAAAQRPESGSAAWTGWV